MLRLWQVRIKKFSLGLLLVAQKCPEQIHQPDIHCGTGWSDDLSSQWCRGRGWSQSQCEVCCLQGTIATPTMAKRLITGAILRGTAELWCQAPHLTTFFHHQNSDQLISAYLSNYISSQVLTWWLATSATGVSLELELCERCAALRCAGESAQVLHLQFRHWQEALPAAPGPVSRMVDWVDTWWMI